jgi:hypothetical protein
MSGNVRIQIKDDEGMLAAMENEVGFVVLNVTGDAAKDALILL